MTDATDEPFAPAPPPPGNESRGGQLSTPGPDLDGPDWYAPPTLADEEEDEAEEEPAIAAPVVPTLPRRRQGPGRVVAVLSGKPGIGKSTVASNLAAAISRDHGLTTAIVDLSLQFGDQALMFDCGSTPSLVDVLANIDALTEDFVLDCMHRGPDLRILSAPPSPELADLVDAGHLQVIMALLRNIFDIVVLDTSSHLSDITLEAMDSSDSLFVVATPYLPAVKDTKLLLKTLSDLGVPARKLTAVLNRLEPGIKMGLDVLEANLKFPISVELPHVPTALIESVTDGVPLVLQKPSSEWGQKISALADIAADPAGATEGRRSKRGFLGLTRG